MKFTRFFNKHIEKKINFITKKSKIKERNKKKKSLLRKEKEYQNEIKRNENLINKREIQNDFNKIFRNYNLISDKEITFEESSLDFTLNNQSKNKSESEKTESSQDLNKEFSIHKKKNSLSIEKLESFSKSKSNFCKSPEKLPSISCLEQHNINDSNNRSLSLRVMSRNSFNNQIKQPYFFSKKNHSRKLY